MSHRIDLSVYWWFIWRLELIYPANLKKIIIQCTQILRIKFINLNYLTELTFASMPVQIHALWNQMWHTDTDVILCWYALHIHHSPRRCKNKKSRTVSRHVKRFAFQNQYTSIHQFNYALRLVLLLRSVKHIITSIKININIPHYICSSNIICPHYLLSYQIYISL